MAAAIVAGLVLGLLGMALFSLGRAMFAAALLALTTPHRRDTRNLREQLAGPPKADQ